MTPIEFEVDGVRVAVHDDGCTLLEALRDRLGIRSPKDGCSPQGQCGCCTVLVDGQPRVACVTPVARIAGRSITTADGLADGDDWAGRLCATGGSQCGFCTPGIIVRLAALPPSRRSDAAVRQALLAHLCRCTGWNSVVGAAGDAVDLVDDGHRDLEAASRRATIEGRSPQRVERSIALGRGGFAADTAPRDALIAVRSPDGEWVVGETLVDARRAAGKVQGRRTTESLRWPVEPPPGEWERTLQTTWVEPAYLETDAAWCAPGGKPVTSLANGGAFGGKVASEVGAAAQRLAAAHGRTVLAQYSREDVVRLGHKRPPLAAGVRADGSGVVRVARTTGVAAAIASVAPNLVVEEVDVVGPPTSVAVRGAGWVEATVLVAGDDGWVRSPDGARARATLDERGEVSVTVDAGEPLDDVALRSYCVGAAHMAMGWVRNEGIAVADDGTPLDLTIRSFGVLRAVDTPGIDVEIVRSDGPPVNGSDAVFAAVAFAAWRHAGFAPRWPTLRA